MRIVRRYKNRKMYDTATNRYITLPELLKVAAIEDVKVVEGPDEKDRTAYSLALAIVLEAKANPTEGLLADLVRLVRDRRPPLVTAAAPTNGSAHTAR